MSELLATTMCAVRQPYHVSALTDNGIWQESRRMISDQLGVPLEQVTKTANFVTDLGCV